MAKPTISFVTGQAQNIAYQVNKVADQLATAIGNKLDRTVTEPMQADIDMNGHKIMNMGGFEFTYSTSFDLSNLDVIISDATSAYNPVTLRQLQQEQAERIQTDNMLATTINTLTNTVEGIQIDINEIMLQVWQQLLLSDGAGSGLDADLLDGQQGSYYTNSANIAYDNTISGLTSSNVKDAIDELATTSTFELVNDTSPQLGGVLDANGYSIVFTEKANTSSSGACTIDWNASNRQKLTLTEDVTVSFSNPSKPTNLVLRIIQDGNGGHQCILPANLKTPSGAGIVLSKTANAEDVLSLFYDGASYIAYPYKDVKTIVETTISRVDDTADELGQGTLSRVEVTPTPSLKLKERPILYFNGTSSYARTTDSYTIFNFGTNPFTIEVRVAPIALPSTKASIVSRQASTTDGYAILLNSNGTITAYTDSASITSATALSTGYWYRIAFVRTATQLQLYINGVAQTAVNVTAVDINNSMDLRIGTSPSGGQFFNGYIRDVRLWNVARTQTEIQADANKEYYENFPTSLVANYLLDEGTGTSSYTNISPSTYILTLYNTSWLTDSNIYYYDGNRIVSLDATALKNITYTNVNWSATLNNQTVTAQYRYSTDNGSTYSAWYNVNQNSSMNIPAQSLVQVKQNLITTSSVSSPEVTSFSVTIKGNPTVL